MRRFEGRVALVTGAGSGIGLATARRLAEEGATVVAALEAEGQRAATAGLEAALLDVRDEADWQRVVADVAARHGRLDVLVNNAGVHFHGTAEETGRADWDRIMAVNLYGTFLGCRAAIPELRRGGGGAIVNLASINSIRGNSRMVAYSASKGGVMALTMALALDHSADSIRVNCVCPGSIDTAMVRGLFETAHDPEALRQAMLAKHPIGRMARPEEVAAVIAFLASDDASFMTGLAVPVDGGRSIR